MAVYYVQISSSWQGSRWLAALKTEDRDLAEYAAETLEIGEHQFGRDNPGLTGRRYSRFISKTKLQRKDGLPAIARAEQDLSEGWEDTEAPTKRISRASQDRAPISSFLWPNVMQEIEQIEDAYREEQEAKAQEGKIDFLIRDMPLPAHAKLKEASEAQGKTMTEVVIALIAEM